MASKIKKGDLVQVISGKDKGKQGRVTNVDKLRDRVTVEGVQLVTRHLRQGQNGSSGGIQTVEAPIHISNVMLVDPETKKPTRVGFREEEVTRGGRKRVVRVRVAKKSGKDVE